jgi:hypothetical protein
LLGGWAAGADEEGGGEVEGEEEGGGYERVGDDGCGQGVGAETVRD